jgi:Cof subfamily protein (haloacid dehalogenase superfamily)
MNPTPAASAREIRLLLSDVDGTLVTQEKVLTDRSRSAVEKLHDAGIVFAITSGRPPLGMRMLVEPLQIVTPIAGFNGGLMTTPAFATIEERVLPADIMEKLISTIAAEGVDVWIYRAGDWFVRDLQGPHVDREARTVQFQPTVVKSFAEFRENIVKVVGVSDDHAALLRAEAATRKAVGDHVAASRSQPYYLDVTHPEANKGAVVRRLSQLLQIPSEQIATIGDMPNDVLMFAHSGLSIAMGNASPEVQRTARWVTTSNEDEGFANAVERFILRSSPGAPRT